MRRARVRAFTLIELLSALAILALLALLSYRALGAVADTREHLKTESAKWRDIAAFFDRFERDIQLAAPGTVRGTASHLVLNRFAGDALPAARVGYAVNDRREIELSLSNARYTMLSDVAAFDVRYLTDERVWSDGWPAGKAAIPRALTVRLALTSGEEIVRTFLLQ